MRVPINCVHWISVTALLVFGLHPPLVWTQQWLVDQLLPPDYDPNQVPLRQSINQGMLFVNGTVALNSFEAGDSQMVLNLLLSKLN